MRITEVWESPFLAVEVQATVPVDNLLAVWVSNNTLAEEHLWMNGNENKKLETPSNLTLIVNTRDLYLIKVTYYYKMFSRTSNKDHEDLYKAGGR